MDMVVSESWGVEALVRGFCSSVGGRLLGDFCDEEGPGKEGIEAMVGAGLVIGDSRDRTLTEEGIGGVGACAGAG
jgi:hypothetical protein